MIIGIKSLSKIGAIINFADNTVTIDKVELTISPHDEFMDIKALNTQFRELLEPSALREATNRAVEILDEKYEKADLASITAQNFTHLSASQQEQLLALLLDYEELFGGTLGDWKTEPVSFKLKPGTTPYHGKAYPIPQVHLKTLKKEVERLCELGVLEPQPDSEWDS